MSGLFRYSSLLKNPVKKRDLLISGVPLWQTYFVSSGRYACQDTVCRLSPARWSTIRFFSRSPGSRSSYSRAFPSSDSGLIRFRRGHSSGAAPASDRIPLTELPMTLFYCH